MDKLLKHFHSLYIIEVGRIWLSINIQHYIRLIRTFIYKHSHWRNAFFAEAVKLQAFNSKVFCIFLYALYRFLNQPVWVKLWVKHRREIRYANELRKRSDKAILKVFVYILSCLFGIHAKFDFIQLLDYK